MKKLKLIVQSNRLKYHLENKPMPNQEQLQPKNLGPYKDIMQLHI